MADADQRGGEIAEHEVPAIEPADAILRAEVSAIAPDKTVQVDHQPPGDNEALAEDTLFSAKRPSTVVERAGTGPASDEPEAAPSEHVPTDIPARPSHEDLPFAPPVATTALEPTAVPSSSTPSRTVSSVRDGSAEEAGASPPEEPLLVLEGHQLHLVSKQEEVPQGEPDADAGPGEGTESAVPGSKPSTAGGSSQAAEPEPESEAEAGKAAEEGAEPSSDADADTKPTTAGEAVQDGDAEAALEGEDRGEVLSEAEEAPDGSEDASQPEDDVDHLSRDSRHREGAADSEAAGSDEENAEEAEGQAAPDNESTHGDEAHVTHFASSSPPAKSAPGTGTGSPVDGESAKRDMRRLRSVSFATADSLRQSATPSSAPLASQGSGGLSKSPKHDGAADFQAITVEPTSGVDWLGASSPEPSMDDMIAEALETRRHLQAQNAELQNKGRQLLEARMKGRGGGGGFQQDTSRLTGQETRYATGLASWARLLEEAERVEADCEARLLEAKTTLDDRMKKAAEGQASFQQFIREVANSAEYSKTGRKIAPKAISQMEDQHGSKAAALQKVRLRHIQLHNALKRLEARVKAKERLSEGLHLIDFEQLKIENQALNEKIEERNEDIVKLRKKTSQTVQVLTHVKEKLQFVRKENEALQDELAGVEEQLAHHRDELAAEKSARDKFKVKLRRLRETCEYVADPLLLEDIEVQKDRKEQLEVQLHTLTEQHHQMTARTAELAASIRGNTTRHGSSASFQRTPGGAAFPAGKRHSLPRGASASSGSPSRRSLPSTADAAASPGRAALAAPPGGSPAAGMEPAWDHSAGRPPADPSNGAGGGFIPAKYAAEGVRDRANTRSSVHSHLSGGFGGSIISTEPSAEVFEQSMSAKITAPLM